MEVLRRDFVGDRVLIIAHQVIVNCFRYLLERMDEAQILAVDSAADVPNCGVTEYGMVDKGGGVDFLLVRANYVSPMLYAGAAITTSADVPTGPK